MRRRAFLGLVLTAPTAALVGLPTVTAAWARPRPVPPSVRIVSLRGVDQASAGLLRHDATPPALLSAPAVDPGFSMLGVTWLAEPGVQLRVQARTRADGRWSPWRALETSPGHRPEGAEARTASSREGTSPLWVGPSDAFQVQVHARGGTTPRDVRVELVDPGTSPADGRMVPRGSAHAAEPQPQIITRAQWGADESIRKGEPTYTSTVRVGFVHHTASSNDYTEAQAAAVVRGIYAYHVKSNGWADIGYNFLVDRYGKVYEGRAGGVDRFVLGAHTGGFNVDSFGVALLGEFSSLTPSASSLGALSTVLAWKLGSAHRDPQGKAQLTSAGGGTSKYPSGTRASFAVVSGHRDAGNTSCPGASTYARLPELRHAVASQLGVGFVDPVVSGGARHQVGQAAAVRLDAGTLGDLAWTAMVTSPSGAILRSASGSGGQVSLGWDITDTTGAPVPPGEYMLTLSGGDGSRRAKDFNERILVTAPFCRGTPLQRVRCRLASRRSR